MNKGVENKGFIYEFGKFVLDPHERVLLADGKPVHLADKVFDTLLLLIQHNGRLLTKDEMMTTLWEESFVEESNLAKNISRLRKILNTDGFELIETLPKRGYRFRADVKEIDGETSLLVHRSLRVKFSQTVENDDEQKTLIDPTSLDEIHSIAVLPFQPLGAKANDDFFGLGITDALITQLSRAGQIDVRPTSAILKYDFLEQDAVSAGQQLQVDAVLEGKFQRLENKLRLTVQMLRTHNGNSLWADSFNAEVEDIFAVQDQIAGRVVGALSKKLTDEAQARLKKRDTENVEAYQQYLKGRFYWNKRTIEGYDEALECFEKAIEIDPSYALAYAGLADIYNLLPLYDGFAPHDYFPKAKANALKALFIDGNLAEAHAALGLAILHYDWNWSGAEVSFQNAIKLNPNYSAAYQLLGVYLCRVDRISEAIIALKKAQELDPLSPINAVWLAEVLRYYGETEASIRLHLETLESFPDFFLAHYHLAFSYIDCGRFESAEFYREKAVSLSNENSLTLSLQGILQAALGNKSAVQETLNKLLKMKAEKYISSANIASVYAASHNEEKAIEWLETALIERDPNLTWIKFDKEFEFLGRNPRFQTLLQEVGLAEKEIKTPQSAIRNPQSKKVLLALSALLAVIISYLGFYFWKREKSVAQTENSVIRLTDNPKHDNHPAWTKDGRIRFIRFGSDRQPESLIMNADGTNQTVVKDFNNLDHGVWSPDGTKVVFVKRGDKTAFYLADADGANEVPLPFFGGNFDWSRDSRKIVHQKNVSVGDPDIFVYSLETAQSENVSNNPAFDADPSFSPDGKQIVFASLRDGNAEIYLMNSDGSDVRRLTNHPAWDNHPIFSPDGTTIAFNSDRENENSDIYFISADGSDLRRLTDWKTNEGVEPGGWSPDGTKIAFISDRDGNDDIFIMSAEIYRPRLVLADESSNL
ncbi:MAG: winged helix-turn-helix domain-containing protein, partial [Acidobacteriota bacterium]|nr:winged helix-turn-helix domain-containing protein [Acidobacteriota bacterium]